MIQLPEGFAVVQDNDGDWWLEPPADVVVFFEPGEMWLVTDDYMKDRNWDSVDDVTAACCEYLNDIGVG